MDNRVGGRAGGGEEGGGGGGGGVAREEGARERNLRHKNSHQEQHFHSKPASVCCMTLYIMYVVITSCYKFTF